MFTSIFLCSFSPSILLFLCVDHADHSCPSLNCSVCTRVIDGEVVLAVGKKVHPECFKCGFCSAVLQKTTCKLKEEKFCCNDCIMKKDANTMANNARESTKAEERAAALAQDPTKASVTHMAYYVIRMNAFVHVCITLFDVVFCSAVVSLMKIQPLW